MLEKWRLKRNLNEILELTLQAGEWNESLASGKILEYKNFRRNQITPGDFILKELEKVKTQRKRFKLIHSFLFDLRYADLLSSNSLLKPVADSMVQIRSLLGNLLGILEAQEKILSSHNPFSINLRRFKKKLHEELQIYKNYRELSATLGPEMISYARKELQNKVGLGHIISGRPLTRQLEEMFAALLIAFISIGSLGYMNHNVLESSINDLKGLGINIFLLGGAVDLLVQTGYYLSILRKLIKLRE